MSASRKSRSRICITIRHAEQRRIGGQKGKDREETRRRASSWRAASESASQARMVVGQISPDRHGVAFPVLFVGRVKLGSRSSTPSESELTDGQRCQFVLTKSGSTPTSCRSGLALGRGRRAFLLPDPQGRTLVSSRVLPVAPADGPHAERSRCRRSSRLRPGDRATRLPRGRLTGRFPPRLVETVLRKNAYLLPGGWRPSDPEATTPGPSRPRSASARRPEDRPTAPGDDAWPPPGS